MKKSLQSVSFLIAGMLILSACTEEKTGKFPEKIANKIDVDLDEMVKDTVPLDSIIVEEPIAPPPPPPPPPEPPWDPLIDPEPWPEPEPEPWPEPVPPPPLPDPVVEPVNQIIEIPEVFAKFPGGEEELNKFIYGELKYPEVAEENGIEANVYVSFVVEMDGAISDAKILRGHPALNPEALRVIQSMPKWEPAKNRGKAVRSITRIPIKFVLMK